MSKSIADRANVSASVILNRKGEHVATVQTLYGSGGGVSVEVFNHDKAALRCLETAVKNGRISEARVQSLMTQVQYCSTPESKRARVAHDLFGLQKGRAGGYGYDKRTAALSGLLIDGHTLANHCGNVPEDEKARARLLASYERAADREDCTKWRSKAARIGCSFANYGHGKNGGASSLYFHPGLERLPSLGYRIISAI
jgi:hypothetical protein